MEGGRKTKFFLQPVIVGKRFHDHDDDDGDDNVDDGEEKEM